MHLTITLEDDTATALRNFLTEVISEEDVDDDADLNPLRAVVSALTRARWQADYDHARAALDATAALCSQCKAAKTRKRNALTRRGVQWAQENPERYASLMNDADTEMCGRHTQVRRMQWVGSPLSETYWAS